ncbi:hypothetical protein [Pontibacter fetidus]|uniref:Uncharacterized protein n=1 Tax=Pontibacter fetidus TaxID=2700082 RepID=A0A6B2GY84_9BACT|nr:hypothetical protein [Pontibacter fetidus]NDK55815.1 hypothetical protein [Pontibacter fetidus]
MAPRALLHKKLNFRTVLRRDHVTIRHCPEEKLIWNEWRGMIPSDKLRDAIIFSCQFIIKNDIELILADYTLMAAPTVEDQVWVANHSAELLQHSKLRRVANLMAQDLFQQIAIESIYDMASEVTLPCTSRDFVVKDDALEWLFSG